VDCAGISIFWDCRGLSSQCSGSSNYTSSASNYVAPSAVEDTQGWKHIKVKYDYSNGTYYKGEVIARNDAMTFIEFGTETYRYSNAELDSLRSRGIIKLRGNGYNEW
jgi:hypothetical protein